MNRLLAAALLLGATLGVAPAQAQETPQNGAFELRMGFLVPNIDSEFDGPGPFEDNFKDDTALGIGLEGDFQFWHGFGSLGIFGAATYGKSSGQGLLIDGTMSADSTSMLLFPLQAGLVYRFDVLAQRFNIPFVRALKGGLNYTLWFIRDGRDDVSTYDAADGKRSRGEGGTAGLQGSIGLHLLLDIFEPHTAKVFDNEMGVNNSYLFVEYDWSWVDEFGSDKSFDLSDSGLVFGLAFEM